MTHSHRPDAGVVREQPADETRAQETPEELEGSAQCPAQETGCDGVGEEAAVITGEHEELLRLRREVWQLRLERDMLRDAANWFARKSRRRETTPS